MVNALKSLWIIALLGTSLNLCAQGGSDAQAKKAAFASAILPGAGQFVNHQAWKAPIAWGFWRALDTSSTQTRAHLTD